MTEVGLSLRIATSINSVYQELPRISALYITLEQKLPKSLLIVYKEWLNRKPRRDIYCPYSRNGCTSKLLVSSTEKLRGEQRKRKKINI